jgi:hypothetical protein
MLPNAKDVKYEVQLYIDRRLSSTISEALEKFKARELINQLPPDLKDYAEKYFKSNNALEEAKAMQEINKLYPGLKKKAIVYLKEKTPPTETIKQVKAVQEIE